MWFFRAIEAENGLWECRRGLEALDDHATLEDALVHLLDLGRAQAPAVLFAHWRDGRVEPIAEVPAD